MILTDQNFQRLAEIKDEGFVWPFFAPKNEDGVHPVAPWATRPSPVDEETECHDLNPETQKNLLEFLTSQMTYPSAYSIGDIHRRLRQPLESPEALAHALNRDNTWNALAFVCVDLNRLPAGLPKIRKEHLVHQLVTWVSSKSSSSSRERLTFSSLAIRETHRGIAMERP